MGGGLTGVRLRARLTAGFLSALSALHPSWAFGSVPGHLRWQQCWSRRRFR